MSARRFAVLSAPEAAYPMDGQKPLAPHEGAR